MKKETKIYCPDCRIIVNATSHNPIVIQDPESDELFYRFSLMQCQKCQLPLFTQEFGELEDGSGRVVEPHKMDWEKIEDILDWSEPLRLWPTPESLLSEEDVPDKIKLPLKKAQRFLMTKDYPECVNNCDIVVEGICQIFGSNENKYFYDDLKELVDRNIISKIILAWALELKKLRNIASHNTDKPEATKEQAENNVKFLYELCNQLFARDRLERILKEFDQSEL